MSLLLSTMQGQHRYEPQAVWRYEDMTDVSAQAVLARKQEDKLRGDWRAFYFAATGLPPPQNRDDPLCKAILSNFLYSQPQPNSKTLRNRYAKVFPEMNILACYPFGHENEFEFQVLAYKLYDARGESGSVRLVSRRQLKAFQNENNTIVYETRDIYPVTAAEFSTWPMIKEIEVEAYKQFKINPGKRVSPAVAAEGALVVGRAGSSIRGYHTTRTGGYIQLGKVDEDFPTFGCELELVPIRNWREAVEGRTRYRNSGAHTVASRILADCADILDIEADGSVSTGFEIVSGFGHFDELDAAMRRVFKLHIEHSVLGTTGRTGLHFHVGWMLINKVLLAKLYAFISKYRHIVVAIAGRSPNRYCPINPISMERNGGVPVWRSALLPCARYNAINTLEWDSEDMPRFEWRSCKATTSYAAWRGRLEFIRHLVEWLNTTPEDVMPKFDDFMDYVSRKERSATVGLRRILTTKAGLGALVHSGVSARASYNGRSEYASLRV